MEENYIEINISNKKAKNKKELYDNLFESKDILKNEPQKYEALIPALNWFKEHFDEIDLPIISNGSTEYYRLCSNVNVFSIQLWENYNNKFDKRVRNVVSNFLSDIDNDENTKIIE